MGWNMVQPRPMSNTRTSMAERPETGMGGLLHWWPCYAAKFVFQERRCTFRSSIISPWGLRNLVKVLSFMSHDTLFQHIKEKLPGPIYPRIWHVCSLSLTWCPPLEFCNPESGSAWVKKTYCRQWVDMMHLNCENWFWFDGLNGVWGRTFFGLWNALNFDLWKNM